MQAQVIVRGNRIHQFPPTAVADPTWTAEDHARFLTLRARYANSSAEVVQCIVWKRKVPGLTYTADIEAKLAEL
jgi:hypothetical protein